MSKFGFMGSFTGKLPLALECLFIALGLIGSCHAAVCGDMEYESHGGVTLKSCHIPSSVTDGIKYCRDLGLGAVYGYYGGNDLCYVPEKQPHRRQISGLFSGGIPGY